QQKLEGIERDWPEWKDDEAEIDLAALHQAQELTVVGRLDQRDVDLRPVGMEAPQQRGEDASADALVGADPERPRVSGDERAQVRLRRTESRGDPIGMPQQQPPGLGERDR